MAEATIEALKRRKKHVHTIASDSGSEFAYHEQISKKLKADFYFARPYSSWERGLNENTNGLVRHYLKKGSSFSDITDACLYNIIRKLNTRPRKSLGYKSPMEELSNKIYKQ